MRCEEMVTKKCACGKTKIQIECYKVSYPDHKRRQLLTAEEIEKIDNLRCNRVCNQWKKCNKHQCKEVCCPVKKNGPDPDGKHLCMIVCNKTLECGKHPCSDFCHIGFCKPCKWISNQPIFCPCGIAKLDPPIKCGVPNPTCGGLCQ